MVTVPIFLAKSSWVLVSIVVSCFPIYVEELLIGRDQLHNPVAASRGRLLTHPTEGFCKANLALGKGFQFIKVFCRND
jgi:hypothetical protein